MRPAGRRVALSFGQSCALWQLIERLGGGPVYVSALVQAIGWRNPWREATTVRALVRKGLIAVDGRTVTATADGRAAWAACRWATRRVVYIGGAVRHA